MIEWLDANANLIGISSIFLLLVIYYIFKDYWKA